MAARKKSARRKSGARRARRSTRAGLSSATLLQIESRLPPALRPYARQMRALAARLEREIEKATARYRSDAQRLLRQAGRELQRLPKRGGSAWSDLDAQARRRILGLLEHLQTALTGARRRVSRGRARRAS